MVRHAFFFTCLLLLAGPLPILARSSSTSFHPAFLLPEPPTRQRQVGGVVHHYKNYRRTQPRNHQQHEQRVPLIQLRGGGSILPIVATTTATAKVASALLGLNGLALLIRPKAKLYETILGASSLAHKTNDEISQDLQRYTWFLRGMGAIGVGTAIHIFLSIVTPHHHTIIGSSFEMHPLRIMGLGLAPRGFFFLWTALSGSVQRLGMNPRFFTINTVLTSWCCLSLIFGLGNPPTTAKVYSIMTFLKACLFVLNPVKGCGVLLLPSSAVGTRVTNNQSSASLTLAARLVGNDLLTSSLLLLATAWGTGRTSPTVAAGSVSLLTLALLVQMACFGPTSSNYWRGPGMLPIMPTRANEMAMTALLVAGFLLGK